jgi:murein L,D-transpeptidase YcbB/YkuD
MALLDQGRPVLTARAVVGMPSRPTPVFADRITHLVFNPSWTVPQSIARADLLPRIRRDPGYLARAGMRVYSGWTPDAQPLHPAAVSWDRVAGRLDSYRLVQAPGPGNPLGRVKFMFPNRHNVYLHDTPDTGLFEHARRAYSSGCIRIDRPMQLARALLARSADWDARRIQRAVASGRTVRAPLDRPVPVRIVYRTAWVDPDGTVQLRPDIYGRDGDLAIRMQEGATGS